MNLLTVENIKKWMESEDDNERIYFWLFKYSKNYTKTFNGLPYIEHRYEPHSMKDALETFLKDVMIPSYYDEYHVGKLTLEGRMYLYSKISDEYGYCGDFWPVKWLIGRTIYEMPDELKPWHIAHEDEE